jgi:hypothetical protein
LIGSQKSATLPVKPEMDSPSVAKAKTTSASLYCLRVELDDIIPSIWRRIWIEGNVALINVHHTIQAAMGWTDAHLHEFAIGGVTYATPDAEDSPERIIVDEHHVQLHKVLNGISRFGYLYDFGDSWQHTITVEKVAPPPQYPRGCAFIEAGERACPPEDAGGSHAYQGFLDRFAKNPKQKEVREFLLWAGKDFDPNRFDRHAANAALLRMAWNQWGKK